ncbi:sensor histidine kinase [Jiangella gansuensis]|uniref:sensor histidine kinase n=1 Tax=Jiangella gansuensis TaxID=281473 RepID=UPI00047E87DA|nr:histidine kinase [Jiangella gansuensis]
MVDRSWLRRHQGAVDVGIAVFVVVLDTATTLAGWTWWPAEPGALAWTLLGLQAVACLSLIFRRRAPLAVVAVLGGFTLAVTLLISPLDALTPAAEDTLWAPFATVIAAYGPLYYRQSRRTALIALAVFAVIIARPWEASATVIMIGLLRTALGPLLALYFTARRRLVLALTERAERAERERHLLAEQARAEERARLAGEMHDVVSHRVSLMVMQAGALRMTAPDDATRRAAEELRAAGSQALDELRDLVGILRTAPDDHDAPPLAGIETLAAESTAAGTPTDLVEQGDRALASPVVGRTAYRIAREALTNVRKHAPGAHVTVRIDYDPAHVHLSIRNTPPRSEPDPGLVGSGSGLGIANLRRRVELVHGSLHAGPAPDGGFVVEATLPSYVPTAESVV